MILRSTTARAAVAGLSALALALTASPALAGGATPLENGVEQTVSGNQSYTYSTEFIYWSVTALRSEGGKPTLTLFSDEAGENQLAKSKQKKSKTEFIAVDSNHATVPSTYYLTAQSKGGDSTIELDKDAEILFDDTPVDVPMTEADVVKVMDVFLVAGEEYTLTVKGDGNAGLFLMRSTLDQTDTYYQSRAEAFMSADKKGAGKAEKITVTGDDDWYGLVVLNNSGSGTYTITKSLAG